MVVGQWNEHKPESINELSQRTANYDNESRRIGRSKTENEVETNRGKHPLDWGWWGTRCSQTQTTSQQRVLGWKYCKADSGKNGFSWRMSKMPYFPCKIEECSFALGWTLFAWCLSELLWETKSVKGKVMRRGQSEFPFSSLISSCRLSSIRGRRATFQA